MNKLLHSLTRLSLSSSKQQLIKNIHTTSSSWIHVTPCVCAEPLKKKKRIDPAVVKAREDRKKKKIEKQIRRLERNARQLKPIDELEIPLNLIDERKQRLRLPPNYAVEVLEQRVLLEKKWAKYKYEQHLADMRMIDRIFMSQQKALDELKKESEELYQEAIQFDPAILPFSTRGPVATPSIKNYEAPDGDYNDVSKKWNE